MILSTFTRYYCKYRITREHLQAIVD